MGTLHRLEHWSATHHPRWLVFLRVALGISLFFKAILFMSDSVHLETMLAQSSLSSFNPWLPMVITWTHLLGGFLIIIGLFTRWAALVQLPIVIGAVIFINMQKGLFATESEFTFSLVVLLLLIFFFVEGGGPISLDNYFKKNPR
jgi:uncharacterized membrane protein YphA (DoxX/SURF4 family)